MRVLAFIGALAVLVAIGAAVYFFGGFYNVAASEPDSNIVAWALTEVRQASISRHAVDTPPGSLDDPALVQAGARAFAKSGCVNCHGGPGVDWAKFSEALNPAPPELKDVVPVLSSAELFWVIKNGIRMTAMPGMSLNGVDDKEIWSIVAFVRKIATISDADYKSWTAAPP